MICRYCNGELVEDTDIRYARCDTCNANHSILHDEPYFTILQSPKYIVEIEWPGERLRIFKTTEDTSLMKMKALWIANASGKIVFQGFGYALVNAFTPFNVQAKVEALLLLS